MNQVIPQDEYTLEINQYLTVGEIHDWADAWGTNHTGWVVESTYDGDYNYAYVVEAESFEEAAQRWAEYNKFLDSVGH